MPSEDPIIRLPRGFLEPPPSGRLTSPPLPRTAAPGSRAETVDAFHDDPTALHDPAQWCAAVVAGAVSLPDGSSFPVNRWGGVR